MRRKDVMMKTVRIGLAMALLMPLYSCGGGGSVGTWDGAKPAMREGEAAKALEGASIFFGHQSVGNNILDGVEALLASEGLSERLAVKRGVAALEGPGLYDAEIGENRDPVGKMADFEARLRAGMGKADAAFMKLCYVDVLDSTDLQALFKEYKAMVARIEAAHPRLRLLHFTVPLTVAESGAKASLKRALGKSVDWDNRARAKYNGLLRAEYGATGRLFDLAMLEATDESGSYREYRSQGEAYLALRPAYAADEGHLNEAGSRRAAAALLSFLAQALK